MNKRRLIGGLVSTGLLSIGLIYTLLYTAPGLGWYLNHAISDLPGRIDIENVHHTLSGDCEIKGLRYRTKQASINFTNIAIKWNPFAIFNDELQIQHFSANIVSVELTNGDPDLFLDNIRKARFPLVINIEQGSLQNVSLQSSRRKTHRIKSVEFSQFYYDKAFYVDKLIVEDYAGDTMEVSGKAGLRSSDIINLTTHTSIRIPGTNSNVQSHGTFVGSTTQLRFLQTVISPYEIKLEGRVKDILSEPYWYFEATIQNANSIAFHPPWQVKSMQGHLTGQGTSSQLEINGTVDLEDALGKTWNSKVAATWGAPKIKFMLSASQPETSPNVNVAIDGNWTYAPQGELMRTLSLAGKWQNLKWSDSKDAYIESAMGEFNFDGDLLRTEIKASNIKIGSTGTGIDKLLVTANVTQQNHIALHGEARTDSGGLVVSGDLVKKGATYKFKTVSLTGKNFALVRKPRAHIIVSPNITLSGDNLAFLSKGTIDIPMANIQLQGLEQTYRKLASLVVDNGEPGSATQQRLIDNINLQFGKSVWMHGYGLNAHVTGNLSLVNLSSHSLLANGELNILQGNYKTDNSQHKVTSGKLKFNKHSLDDPELELVVDGSPVSNKDPETVKGLLQSLYKKQHDGKLALNP